MKRNWVGMLATSMLATALALPASAHDKSGG